MLVSLVEPMMISWFLARTRMSTPDPEPKVNLPIREKRGMHAQYVHVFEIPAGRM